MTAYVCSRCLRASKSSLRPPFRISPSTRRLHTVGATPRASTPLTQPRTAHALSCPQQIIASMPFIRSVSTTTTSTPLPSDAATPSISNSAAASATPSTHVLLNSRYDETGAEMSVAITPRAARRLETIMAKDKNPALCLRVSVESGGCHGFQYLMSLVDASSVDLGDDTVFVLGEVDTAAGLEDAQGRAKVVMDEASLELLKGSKVDYTMELIGSQFKIVDNPKATSSCGCGTSFDVSL
ncbi:hypothetical protein EJ06DRAFT_550324 [Trichodelitschia bisporula]|uniref:Core domain-containing protein n=1 Tax=Trichodelitschia bisporula TaxID=703511 RepID=A0A6G1HR67_9PEZI|nr:hypothetical protein EJ06DRAFT_550324 [Trichodelitschia bisporula]